MNVRCLSFFILVQKLEISKTNPVKRNADISDFFAFAHLFSYWLSDVKKGKEGKNKK